jgi:ribosome-binding factor A
MSHRIHKVACLLKKEISDILQTRIKDPLIGFVTIMSITLTNDLRIAKVYVSVLGKKEQQETTMRGLIKATSFIQNELSRRVRLRYLPELHFYLDDTLNYRERIDNILHNLDLEVDDMKVE